MSTESTQKPADIEKRVLSQCDMAIEDRADDDGLPKLVGYASIFGRKTELWPGVFERVQEGAFKRALEEGADVRALVDHDPSKIIGRNKAGTLELLENKRGLKVTIHPPDTQVGRDIVESIRRRDVTQMSFSFRVVEESWKDHQDGTSTRTLMDVDLFDVAPTTYPQYPDTTIATRSLALHRGLEPGEVLGSAFVMGKRTSMPPPDGKRQLDTPTAQAIADVEHAKAEGEKLRRRYPDPTHGEST